MQPRLLNDRPKDVSLHKETSLRLASRHDLQQSHSCPKPHQVEHKIKMVKTRRRATCAHTRNNQRNHGNCTITSPLYGNAAVWGIRTKSGSFRYLNYLIERAKIQFDLRRNVILGDKWGRKTYIMKTALRRLLLDVIKNSEPNVIILVNHRWV